jgi:hypothetical protein
MGAKSPLLRGAPRGEIAPTTLGAKSASLLYFGAPAPKTGGGRGVGVHLKCLYCGRSFEHRLKPSGRLPRTCSPECRRARKQGQDQQYRREGRYRPYERRGLRRTYTGTCVVCGLAFSSKNKRTRTCGSKCGAILNGRIRTERARGRNSRRCELCDSAFQPANPSAKQRRAGHQQRFCSSKCANAARRPRGKGMTKGADVVGRDPEKWAGLSPEEASEIQQRCEAALVVAANR